MLHVLEETIRVLTVASVGWTARRLHIADTIRLGAKHAQESLGRHCSGTNLKVVGLLQHAALLSPKILQTKDEFLEGQWILRGCQVIYLSRTEVRLRPRLKPHHHSAVYSLFNITVVTNFFSTWRSMVCTK